MYQGSSSFTCCSHICFACISNPNKFIQSPLGVGLQCFKFKRSWLWEGVAKECGTLSHKCLGGTIPISLVSGALPYFGSSVDPIQAPPLRQWSAKPPPSLHTHFALKQQLGGLQNQSCRFSAPHAVDINCGVYLETQTNTHIRHFIPRQYGFVVKKTQCASNGFSSYGPRT